MPSLEHRFLSAAAETPSFSATCQLGIDQTRKKSSSRSSSSSLLSEPESMDYSPYRSSEILGNFPLYAR